MGTLKIVAEDETWTEWKTLIEDEVDKRIRREWMG